MPNKKTKNSHKQAFLNALSHTKQKTKNSHKQAFLNALSHAKQKTKTSHKTRTHQDKKTNKNQNAFLDAPTQRIQKPNQQQATTYQKKITKQYHIKQTRKNQNITKKQTHKTQTKRKQQQTNIKYIPLKINNNKKLTKKIKNTHTLHSTLKQSKPQSMTHTPSLLLKKGRNIITSRINSTHKTNQIIKRKYKAHKNTQTNIQTKQPPNVITNKPNNMKLTTKNQNKKQTKHRTKPITNTLKRARPTGLAQSQHNKHKHKTSKKQTSHNNHTFTKIPKHKNTLFKKYPTYSLKIKIKHNTETKCKHNIKIPNQTHTQNSKLHHTTPNKTHKCIKHLTQPSGLAQNHGKTKHNKIIKHFTQTNPEKGRSPFLSTYPHIRKVKKIGLMATPNTNTLKVKQLKKAQCPIVKALKLDTKPNPPYQPPNIHTHKTITHHTQY